MTAVRYFVDDVGSAVDLAAAVGRLRVAGARFRNEVVAGPGGSQVLVEDPAGNPVELFQARG